MPRLARPGKGRFARMMIDRLRATAAFSEIRYEPDEFELVCEGESEGRLSLTNWYGMYCATAESNREELLANLIQGLRETHGAIRKEFKDVSQDLLPKIYSRCLFQSGALVPPSGVMADSELPFRVLADALGATVVCDLPNSFRSVGKSDLTRWSVSFEEALDKACLNLRAISEGQFARPLPGVWRSPWRDNLDSSRLLLTDLIESVDVLGDVVAMIPNRDTLLLTGSEDDQGLANIAAIAENELNTPWPVHGAALRLESGIWVPFLPSPDHPVYERFRAFQFQSEGNQYEAQSRFLKTHYPNSQVATYMGLTERESGKSGSGCIWQDGDLLLPRTEFVAGIRSSKQSADEYQSFLCEWERVSQIVGDLMEPLDVYPPRFRVRSLPSEEQFNALIEIASMSMMERMRVSREGVNGV
jgi:hypothetical protein